jgi:hypothetical protein
VSASEPFVAGGYLLVKPGPPIPAGILTASACLAEMAPDFWAIEWVFYLYSSDLDAYRERLIEAGIPAGRIEKPFYAPRGEFRVVDPDGYCLMVTHT